VYGALSTAASEPEAHCGRADAAAETQINAMIASLDREKVALPRARVSGARGPRAQSTDPLTTLDSNESYASRLAGSPQTNLRRLREFADLGVDRFHVALHDQLFSSEVPAPLNASR
jgi:alkanesulfonate monooxygenase SsuD/methylene tetrahydromethanopterin reductase-like flavin-dependent oxidoreductase (luciferase family)